MNPNRLRETQRPERITNRSLRTALVLRLGIALLTVGSAVSGSADNLRSLLTGGSVSVAEAACESIQTSGTITMRDRYKYETDPATNGGRQERMPDGSKFSVVYEPQTVRASEINGRPVIGRVNQRQIDGEDEYLLAQLGRYFTHTQASGSEQQIHELTVPANTTKKDNCGNDLPAAEVWVYPHLGQDVNGFQVLSNDPRPDTHFDTGVVRTGKNQDGVGNAYVLKQPETVAVTPVPTATPTPSPIPTATPTFHAPSVPRTGDGSSK